MRSLAGAGPPPLAATAPDLSPAPNGLVWAQGNDSLEQLGTSADGVAGTVLHMGKIVKRSSSMRRWHLRVQVGISIRRWNRRTGKDELVWDPFRFLDPLSERTTAANSDPGNNSDIASPFPCAGKSIQVQEWLRAKSLQLSPDEFL